MPICMRGGISRSTARKLWLCSARLRFPCAPLPFRHADLRVSLREVRLRQRDSGAFQQVEGCEVSTLRLDQTGKETVRVRVIPCSGGRGGRLLPVAHRQARRLRLLLWRRRASPSLNPPLAITGYSRRDRNQSVIRRRCWHLHKAAIRFGRRFPRWNRTLNLWTVAASRQSAASSWRRKIAALSRYVSTPRCMREFRDPCLKL